ncbi:hypothetical protein ABS784_10685 [Geobacillus sp. G4]|uniref:hypothetical protein n=1 Tax=Geobacillus TaxID=129337 RepID=UPI00333911EB
MKYLFVTHFHPDHAGMVENIKKFGTSFILFEHTDVHEQFLLSLHHENGNSRSAHSHRKPEQG